MIIIERFERGATPHYRTCGWWVSAEPQVWRTDRVPLTIAADPKHLGARIAAFPSFPGPLALGPCQPVERALDGGDHASGHMDITCGGFQLLMTQEYLGSF
jgi:hypothetical protein